MDIPGEKLIIKLWESCADRAIGSLLKPWQIKREGLAQVEVRRQETLLLAQAEKDADDIRKGLKIISGSGTAMRLIGTVAPKPDGKVEPTLDLDSLASSVTHARTANAIREEVNVAKALLHAEATLSRDDSPVPAESINDDWMYRWRDSAASVSSEQMQSLWGSVLAGEVKSPGSFSLRTLDFLKNLSIEEARAIEDFSPFVLGAIVPRYGPVEEKAEPGIAHLLMLQELGLISGVGGTGLQFTASGGGASSYFRILFSRRRGIALRHSDAGKVLHLNTYRVTPLGSQVFTLPKVEPDEECLFATARACQSQGFSVSIVDLQEAPGQPGTFLMTSETPLPDSPLPQ